MKIVSIIVLYNDTEDDTLSNIKNLAERVDCLYIIDNSADSSKFDFNEIKNTIYLPQYKNIGIAAAQNIGIRKAIEDKADYIFFADPDSEFPQNTVNELLSKYQCLQNINIKVGGVCASAFNETTGLPISLEDCFIREMPDLKVKEISYMMNSGSLIPTNLFQEVGLMWEDLFIDGVDSEWCWRASKKANVRFFQNEEITIQHHLGNQAKKVGNKMRSIASPARLYYQYRNYFWLWKTGYTPKDWLKHNGFKYVIKAFYFPLFVAPRLKNLHYILKGIYYGLKTHPQQ